MMNGMAGEKPSEEGWDDPFAPPTEPCECSCLHCGRTFMSAKMWFQRVKGSEDGFWMCPTPNCGGAGFCFDIFPTDPKHPANDGWHHSDDDEDQAYDDDDDTFDEPQDSDDGAFEFFDVEMNDPEYDPAEPQYRALDEWSSDDDDIEGEEWKYGLQPGEPPEPRTAQWTMEEQEQYDEPDRRPREIELNDTDRSSRDLRNDEDIPF